MLERYNHLRYQDQPPAEDDFVDFLYENSEIEAPDADVDQAWEALSSRIASPAKRSFPWLKIAASIAIIFTISFFVWQANTPPERVDVASLDQQMNVTFPDGSTVVLNEYSSVSFPEKFGDARSVSFKGEAYFDIKKSEKPFIIDVEGVEVKVLGTAFNLLTSEDEVELYVDRGLVAFVKDETETRITAGSAGVFNRSTQTVDVTDDPSPNIMSWQNGSFKFDDTSLSEVIEELEKYYKVEFKLHNNKLANCKITSSFENNSIKEILQVLESLLDVKTEQKGRIIEVFGKGC